jgi:hypothetical protein
MKKFFMGVFIVALLLATFATLPRVDYVEPNVLFYFQHLTPLYYICVLAAIVMAIYWRRSYLGLLSAIVLSLLILWTPSIMLVQPWFPDTYPFVAEAVYVVRNGHLGDFHYLSINPALGLFFGPFLMITGINPFMLIKIYPGIVAVIFTVLLYLIAKKMKIGKESLVVAPLLFLSIAWPNELHLCRQSFSLAYYLMSWFLLLRLVFQGPDRRIFVLLVTQVVLLTMSHPATPLFFMANLVAIAIIGRVLREFRPKESSVITQTLLISAVAWIFWNALNPATGAIRNFIGILENLVASLTENPSEVSGITKIFAQYTPVYELAINIRFGLTLAVFASAMLLSLFTMYQLFLKGFLTRIRLLRKWFMFLKMSIDRTVLVILTGWITSNLFTSIPLLYAGLPYFARPVLFTLIAWAPLGTLAYGILATKQKSGLTTKTKKAMRCVFLVAFVVLPSLLIPIIKYGPLPFLYPTSKELANKRFLDLHMGNSGVLVYFEYNLPYSCSYILDWHTSTHGPRSLTLESVYSPGKGLDTSLIDQASLWITYRLVTRDAFNIYIPSMLNVVENVTQILPETSHNKVYDSGWPEWVLTPTSNLKR